MSLNFFFLCTIISSTLLYANKSNSIIAKGKNKGTKVETQISELSPNIIMDSQALRRLGLLKSDGIGQMACLIFGKFINQR